MKTILTTILFIMVVFGEACFFIDEPEPKTELEKLPPLTTTGEENFGCLINGRAFASRHSGDNRAVFQNGHLQFSGEVDDQIGIESVYFNLSDPLEENVTYMFEPTGLRPWAEYTIIDNTVRCIYERENTIDGSISFSKIDRINWIASGTFEFSTAIQGCDTIHITDGRFDLKYIP